MKAVTIRFMNFCSHGPDDVEKMGGERCQVCLVEEIERLEDDVTNWILDGNKMRVKLIEANKEIERLKEAEHWHKWRERNE